MPSSLSSSRARPVRRSSRLDPSRLAPAAWCPVSYDPEDFKHLMRSNIKQLKAKAHKLGIDDNLTKKHLVESILAKKNVFFPSEMNYRHATLVHFVVQLKASTVTRLQAEQKTKRQLNQWLLRAWKGGSESHAEFNLQHLWRLYDLRQGLEAKMCSPRIQKLLRTSHTAKKPSILTLTDAALHRVLSLQTKWMKTPAHLPQRRKLYLKTEQAMRKAERVMHRYIRFIQEYCAPQGVMGHCHADNIPAPLVRWFKNSKEPQRTIMCNVSVRGRKAQFKPGQRLRNGYVVRMVVEEIIENRERNTKESVTWLGLSTQTQGQDAVWHESPGQQGRKIRKKKKSKKRKSPARTPEVPRQYGTDFRFDGGDDAPPFSGGHPHNDSDHTTANTTSNEFWDEAKELAKGAVLGGYKYTSNIVYGMIMGGLVKRAAQKFTDAFQHQPEEPPYEKEDDKSPDIVVILDSPQSNDPDKGKSSPRKYDPWANPQERPPRPVTPPPPPPPPGQSSPRPYEPWANPQERPPRPGEPPGQSSPRAYDPWANPQERPPRPVEPPGKSKPREYDPWANPQERPPGKSKPREYDPWANPQERPPGPVASPENQESPPAPAASPGNRDPRRPDDPVDRNTQENSPSPVVPPGKSFRRRGMYNPLADPRNQQRKRVVAPEKSFSKRYDPWANPQAPPKKPVVLPKKSRSRPIAPPKTPPPKPVVPPQRSPSPNGTIQKRSPPKPILPPTGPRYQPKIPPGRIYPRKTSDSWPQPALEPNKPLYGTGVRSRHRRNGTPKPAVLPGKPFPGSYVPFVDPRNGIPQPALPPNQPSAGRYNPVDNPRARSFRPTPFQTSQESGIDPTSEPILPDQNLYGRSTKTRVSPVVSPRDLLNPNAIPMIHLNVSNHGVSESKQILNPGRFSNAVSTPHPDTPRGSPPELPPPSLAPVVANTSTTSKGGDACPYSPQTVPGETSGVNEIVRNISRPVVPFESVFPDRGLYSRSTKTRALPLFPPEERSPQRARDPSPADRERKDSNPSALQPMYWNSPFPLGTQPERPYPAVGAPSNSERNELLYLPTSQPVYSNTSVPTDTQASTPERKQPVHLPARPPYEPPGPRAPRRNRDRPYLLIAPPDGSAASPGRNGSKGVPAASSRRNRSNPFQKPRSGAISSRLSRPPPPPLSSRPKPRPSLRSSPAEKKPVPKFPKRSGRQRCFVVTETKNKRHKDDDSEGNQGGGAPSVTTVVRVDDDRTSGLGGDVLPLGSGQFEDSGVSAETIFFDNSASNSAVLSLFAKSQAAVIPATKPRGLGYPALVPSPPTVLHEGDVVANSSSRMGPYVFASDTGDAQSRVGPAYRPAPNPAPAVPGLVRPEASRWNLWARWFPNDSLPNVRMPERDTIRSMSVSDWTARAFLFNVLNGVKTPSLPRKGTLARSLSMGLNSMVPVLSGRALDEWTPTVVNSLLRFGSAWNNSALSLDAMIRVVFGAYPLSRVGYHFDPTLGTWSWDVFHNTSGVSVQLTQQNVLYGDSNGMVERLTGYSGPDRTAEWLNDLRQGRLPGQPFVAVGWSSDNGHQVTRALVPSQGGFPTTLQRIRDFVAAAGDRRSRFAMQQQGGLFALRLFVSLVQGMSTQAMSPETWQQGVSGVAEVMRSSGAPFPLTLDTVRIANVDPDFEPFALPSGQEVSVVQNVYSDPEGASVELSQAVLHTPIRVHHTQHLAEQFEFHTTVGDTLNPPTGQPTGSLVDLVARLLRSGVEGHALLNTAGKNVLRGPFVGAAQELQGALDRPSPHDPFWRVLQAAQQVGNQVATHASESDARKSSLVFEWGNTTERALRSLLDVPVMPPVQDEASLSDMSQFVKDTVARNGLPSGWNTWIADLGHMLEAKARLGFSTSSLFGLAFSTYVIDQHGRYTPRPPTDALVLDALKTAANTATLLASLPAVETTCPNLRKRAQWAEALGRIHHPGAEQSFERVGLDVVTPEGAVSTDNLQNVDTTYRRNHYGTPASFSPQDRDRMGVLYDHANRTQAQLAQDPEAGRVFARVNDLLSGMCRLANQMYTSKAWRNGSCPWTPGDRMGLEGESAGINLTQGIEMGQNIAPFKIPKYFDKFPEVDQKWVHDLARRHDLEASRMNGLLERFADTKETSIIISYWRRQYWFSEDEEGAYQDMLDLIRKRYTRWNTVRHLAQGLFGYSLVAMAPVSPLVAIFGMAITEPLLKYTTKQMNRQPWFQKLQAWVKDHTSPVTYSFIQVSTGIALSIVVREVVFNVLDPNQVVMSAVSAKAPITDVLSELYTKHMTADAQMEGLLEKLDPGTRDIILGWVRDGGYSNVVQAIQVELGVTDSILREMLTQAKNDAPEAIARLLQSFPLDITDTLVQEIIGTTLPLGALMGSTSSAWNLNANPEALLSQSSELQRGALQFLTRMLQTVNYVDRALA